MNNKNSPDAGPPDLLHQAMETYVLFPLFAVVILIVIWMATFRLIEVEREAVERGAADSARELVEIYDAQMIRNLGTIDQTLRTVAYAYAQQDSALILAELKEKGLLPSTLVFTVRVADAGGTVIASTRPEQEVSIAMQPFFLEHQAKATSLPVIAMIPLASGDLRLLFSRRLDAPDGAFRGVVMVSVEPAYFTSGYDEAKLGKHGVLGLVKEDGTFLIQRSGDQLLSGQFVDLGAIGYGVDADKESSVLVVSDWDGVTRYTNTRGLYGFPLTVLVGLSRAEQFEGYQHQKRDYLWAAAAASVLVLLIAAMLTRLSWQLSKNRKRTRKDQETYYAASEASLDAVFVLRSMHNTQGAITDFWLDNANGRAASMFGKTKADLLGRTLCEMLPASRDNGVLEEFARVAQTGAIHEHEWKNDLVAVRAKWLYRQVVRVEEGVVVILRDISERKEVEERINYMAHHDALTGLPNRALLADRIEQAISYADRYGQSMAVVFMDLDKFKLVNDKLGHRAGDELLKAVATRMTQCVRRTDTVVRMGGDEFVLVLVGHSGQPDAVAAILQKIRAAVAEPLYIEGTKLEVTTSMGVAVYPGDGASCDDLLMNADAAMYQAKSLGRDNYHFFTGEVSGHAPESVTLEDSLRSARGRDEFFLLYQPQVNLASGAIIGTEALIRWQHPSDGLMLPASFIDLAEETGLIVPIGGWVLRTACLQNKAWQDAGWKPMTISVNVSARQFQENNLMSQVEAALEESGLEAKYLELEVTESMIMFDLEHALSVMRGLQDMGVQLSIDDFGTGYSSLSVLKKFPIGRIKLDQSFVVDLPHDEADQAIARAVISLGHELGLQVLAEGVETAAQRAFLKENACDEIQGYCFSRPIAASEVDDLLAERATLLQEH